jgi:hypothetical protein
MSGSALWYVAYGSNLDRDRLLAYLAGGEHGDAGHDHPGAADPTPPTAERVVTLPAGLWFGGTSRKWHGGTAHLDREREGEVIGRAWRLTAGQVADIAAQESGLHPGSVRLTAPIIDAGGEVVAGSRYGVVVPLQPIGPEPAVTFTFTSRPQGRDPSPAYLATLVRGLRQCGLDSDAISRYLTGHGMAGHLVRCAAV